MRVADNFKGGGVLAPRFRISERNANDMPLAKILLSASSGTCSWWEWTIILGIGGFMKGDCPRGKRCEMVWEYTTQAFEGNLRGIRRSSSRNNFSMAMITISYRDWCLLFQFFWRGSEFELPSPNSLKLCGFWFSLNHLRRRRIFFFFPWYMVYPPICLWIPPSS